MEFIKKIQRSNLRKVMRGYRILKNSGRLGDIPSIKTCLTTEKLQIKTKHFSSLLMGSRSPNELVIRQYLLAYLGGLRLNKALLISLGAGGKVVCPLPSQWRQVIERHGYHVAHLRSEMLWRLLMFGMILYGICKIFKITTSSFSANLSADNRFKSYVYFFSLGKQNIPINDDPKCRNIISWYLQWEQRRRDIDEIQHGVKDLETINIKGIKIVSETSGIPCLRGNRELGKYILWSSAALALVLIDFCRGRWWSALIFSEAGVAAQVRILPGRSLAREYFFHNSAWIYRPLWSYEAEAHGALITFYFYSTNCESFKRSCGTNLMYLGYQSMTWPRYLVWDTYQAEFIVRAVGCHAMVEVVGPIWFSGEHVDLSFNQKPSVAVFDITPHRFSRYCMLGEGVEYFIPEIANLFIEHVSLAISESGVSMLWKRKRDIGRLAHPVYRKFSDEVAMLNHVYSVDPSVAADYVIQTSFAVISRPFTSTAIIAKNMGYPTVYYDPCGDIKKDDPAAHGIQIISGISNLSAWISLQHQTALS